MSFDLLKTAKYVKGLSNAEFRVLFFLLESANNGTFECFVSMKTIAYYTGMKERTVQRHVTELAERGLFERVEQRRDDGSRAVNGYRFVVSGTVKVGAQDVVVINGHEPHQPAKNGRLSATRQSDAQQPAIPVRTTRHSRRDISLDSISQDSNLRESEQDELFGIEEAPQVSATDHAVATLIEKWNTLASLNERVAPIARFSNQRRLDVEARLKEYGVAHDAEKAADLMRDFVRRIHGSPFHCGDNDRGWVVTPAWALEEKHFGKLLELPDRRAAAREQAQVWDEHPVQYL